MCKCVSHNCFYMSQQIFGHIPLPPMVGMGRGVVGQGVRLSPWKLFSCRVISQTETDAVSNIRTHEQDSLTRKVIVEAKLNIVYRVTQCCHTSC